MIVLDLLKLKETKYFLGNQNPVSCVLYHLSIDDKVIMFFINECRIITYIYNYDIHYKKTKSAFEKTNNI